MYQRFIGGLKFQPTTPDRQNTHMGQRGPVLLTKNRTKTTSASSESRKNRNYYSEADILRRFFLNILQTEQTHGPPLTKCHASNEQTKAHIRES